EPGEHGLTTEDVWFRAADGVDLHGWWIGHPSAEGTLLYCHGSSGSIAQRVGVLRHLAELRLNLFAFDYRGYGRSGGVPSERGLYADARAAYDHLVAERGSAAGEILLFGHSLGGAVAIETARQRPAAGLVVQSSFTDLKEMARALYPQVPLHWITRNQFRSIEKVAELTLPKLFVHGVEDRTVPLAVGRRLYEAAAPPKELYLVERAGHNDVHLHGGAAYARRLARFRNACLGS
ncbi:MAG TPA: alpha/beta hydrolase, partial [Thermoanaerobaculia bacterium]|nr:alpha/beta hydrolase [Thermoanaerobaculia bacterium]